jgi:hypothetical protein
MRYSLPVVCVPRSVVCEFRAANCARNLLYSLCNTAHCSHSAVQLPHSSLYCSSRFKNFCLISPHSTTVAQQLSELNEANALADSIMIMQIKAEIERLLSEMSAEPEMAEVHVKTEMHVKHVKTEMHVKTEVIDTPHVHPDLGITREQYKSEVEKKLIERADAAGKSPHELAFLELREQMSKLRAAHEAHSKHKAD